MVPPQPTTLSVISNEEHRSNQSRTHARRRSNTAHKSIFQILCGALIIGTGVFGFLTWRVNSISQEADIYFENHNAIAELTKEYTAVLDVFQKSQNRSYESDFSYIITASSLLKEDIDTTQNQLKITDSILITRQISQIKPLLESMSEVVIGVSDYSELMQCVQLVEKDVQKANISITQTDLSTLLALNSNTTLSGETIQQTLLDPLTQLRDYFSDLSETNTRFVGCYEPSKNSYTDSQEPVILDLIRNSDETKTAILQYSQALLDFSSKLDLLIQEITNKQYSQAEVTSSQIVEFQAALYDMTPESKIFVPSVQTKNNIDRVSAMISDYNQFHTSISE